MTGSLYKLSDLLSLKYGKGLPKTKRKSGSVPVYGSGGIDGYHNKYFVNGPGIIVGRKGSIGTVYWEPRNFFPIDTTYFVEVSESVIRPRFAYYLLKSMNLKSLNTDSAVPGLNRTNAHNQTVRCPKLAVQDDILKIVTTYDDLIENNRRRIQFLEKAAHMLYREWFIKFRFPGHEHVKFVDGLPVGWCYKALKEIAILNYGKGLKADTRIEGSIPVFGSSGIVGNHNQALVKGPGIILGRKGNVGSVFYSHGDFFPIDTVYYIDSKQTNLFLYQSLQIINFINSDSAVPGLNRNNAYAQKILYPRENIIEDYLFLVQPMIDQINHLTKYNNKIQLARDILLPKLINGDISHDTHGRRQPGTEDSI